MSQLTREPGLDLSAPRGRSARIRELIREGARIALNPQPEWLDHLDRATLGKNATIAEDPVLAAAVRRASRANLFYWAAANVRDPGAPVPANLGPEPLALARDLVRRGLDSIALEIYRVGQDVAWRDWIEIAFELSADPHELRELLVVSSLSISEFIGATLAGIAAQVELEHHELARGSHAERREIAEQILNGAAIRQESAEATLGYSLDRPHTATILWSDDFEGDHIYLDRAADAFSQAVGSTRRLTVAPTAATRWVWVADAADLDGDAIEQALNTAPGARVAIGPTAHGIEGFRRSHLDALATQRMVTRLQSHQRVAFFNDIQLVDLITQNTETADRFIKSTLGEFESANPELRAILLTYLHQQCNVSRTAKLLFSHRNTLLRRLESAERMLPRPLSQTYIRVAVALEALQWRGNHPNSR
ncbi:Purine catabolism regulatory protein [Mycobacterium simulans]|uniref:Purine catabolism regulatory protein n=1 Tax=Mycobacterium simulans TaxID=627089 RepID=A0A7Z7NC47_9MYCO|nr:PucR family transcriptional regulator [Mycobacterium simulans]SOJ57520.1 Purine catabolism regulatory protein [Mycobacterium simulans]